MIDALAQAGIPTIPVRVWYEDRWRKQPLGKWGDATTDCEMLARWERQWPEALPGVPLERVGWVAIDVDADDPAFWEIWNGLGPRGPYSKIQTVSGGWHFVFAQPDPPIGKMQWSQRNVDVEILGASCLLTVYDVEEILFPRVAPRAVLPEVFRKPYARPEGNLINKPTHVAPPAVPVAVDVAEVVEALFALDPHEWRNRHDAWLALANGAKFEGVSEADWVRWCLGDEWYRRDERLIRRKWHSLTPRHGGAFWAALSAHGIKVRRRGTDTALTARSGSLIDEVPHGAGIVAEAPSRPARLHDLRDTARDLCAWLNAAPSEPHLFRVGCVFAERGMLREVALSVLKSNCPALRRALGNAEFTRSITNAYARIEGKQNAGENQNDQT
jgi:hypothetical protein